MHVQTDKFIKTSNGAQFYTLYHESLPLEDNIPKIDQKNIQNKQKLYLGFDKQK